MREEDHRNWGKAGSFLGSLFRDARANTLVLMAMALIPLAGMVGGGVDISRMYIVKTRLQHACDAGALAGRKAMGGGTWAYSSYYPRTSAEKFFDANYNSEAYGATSVTRSFSENAGKVTGTATAVLPMTLMRVFGRTEETLTVVCDAEMRLPNTDIMFVLDVTGSMGEIPLGDTVTKISSLKSAVKCFYEIVARLDSSEVCTTGTPSGGTGNQVQIRFGFVPYATNVNVGKLLPPAFFADEWPYQSREWVPGSSSWVQSGSPAVSSKTTKFTGISSSTCTTTGVAAWNSTTESIQGNSKQVTVTTHTNPSWSSKKSGTCSVTVTTVKTTYTGQGSSGSRWHYGQIVQDISGLKNGSSWNSSFTAPIGSNGSAKTITWDGCIEERQTVRASTYYPIPGDANDLDIDQVPDADEPGSLWGPALPGMIYTRAGLSSYSTLGWTTAESYTTTDYANASDYYCPTESRKLQSWPVASSFDSYVNSLTPSGNTYHDIGLLWGARLLSPTGIFASENALTPQGGEIERNMIFMTDGDPCTSATNYTAYGVSWFDRRQTDPNVVPSGGCSTSGTLTTQVNERTAALCTEIKNKNITLWVITFGTLDSTTVNRMTACASSGRYFNATNAATIQSTFKSIADQISQLRLTR